MAGESKNDRDPVLRRAHALITEALDLLDAYGGSQAASAHLAMALDELRESSKNDKGPSRD